MSQHTTRSNHHHKIRLFHRRRSVPCFWCNAPQQFHTATIDHIIALSLGGRDDHSNTVVACQKCNRARSYLQMIKGWIDRAAAMELQVAADPRNLLKLRKLKRLRKLLKRHADAIGIAKADHERSKEIASERIPPERAW